jgi:hypothetical protein
MTLPEGIIILDYCPKQKNFHFENNPDAPKHNSWKRLKAMTYDDAIAFAEFMDKKYVDGRKTGDLPELSIVKLELELFQQLKTTRRKYAGR